MQGIETETAVTENAIPLAAELVPELIAADNTVLADDAWAAPSWGDAALDYHKHRGDRVSITSICWRMTFHSGAHGTRFRENCRDGHI
jgi:hypothetical protein